MKDLNKLILEEVKRVVNRPLYSIENELAEYLSIDIASHISFKIEQYVLHKQENTPIELYYEQT